MHLFLGDRPVLDASGHDKQLPGPKLDIVVPKLNRELAFQNQKEVVCIRV